MFIDLGVEEAYKDLLKKYNYDIKKKLLLVVLSEASKDFIKNSWPPTRTIQLLDNAIDPLNDK